MSAPVTVSFRIAVPIVGDWTTIRASSRLKSEIYSLEIARGAERKNVLFDSSKPSFGEFTFVPKSKSKTRQKREAARLAERAALLAKLLPELKQQHAPKDDDEGSKGSRV